MFYNIQVHQKKGIGKWLRIKDQVHAEAYFGFACFGFAQHKQHGQHGQHGQHE